MVVTEAATQATNLPDKQKCRKFLIRGLCARKLRESENVKGIPPKTALSRRGTSPPKPTPGVGEERVRLVTPVSRRLRLLDRLRSCFAAASRKRGRFSASPLMLPFRYSSV